MNKLGALALVGSGEYLPVMQDLESELLKSGVSNGKANRYVQIPTAAGRESSTRLDYWREIGGQQCRRIGTVQNFLPVFNREDAFNDDLIAKVKGAGLIYFSGGDPHYLASTLLDTPLWNAIRAEWESGSALGGCSAGAMAMSSEIPNFRKLRDEPALGFSLLPNIRVIPHYNKFFGWIPDSAAKILMKTPEGVRLIGIDEDTALVTGLSEKTSLQTRNWEVIGKASVHILRGGKTGKYEAPSIIEI
jgi:cyanophycinase-like exopeptidase